ncbi:histidine-type phosphatase [Asticcacaulis solisilvae]|uniref:histidine-type phosphatase n=1 Tax=Asticcacaulis solisilvae TaxID=1217274 RepID=UPI003FD77C2B
MRGLLLTVVACLAWASCARATPAAPEPGYTLSRVVVVMRHGIRPPTKAVVVPAEVSTRQWPSWDVAYGYLTGHGAKAIAELGRFDARTYAGLWPKGCAAESGSMRVVADTDERTLKTAESYVGAGFAGCAEIEHVTDGKPDPRFSPFETGTLPDAAKMLAAAGTDLPAGGLATLDAANKARLDALSAVLGCNEAACRLSSRATAMDASKGRVKISGGLDIASTAGQVLMLEYADGKPLNAVGWGKVTRDQIRDFLTFHALEFQLVARPRAIADFGAGPLLSEVRQGLFGDGARYTLLVGHDSNLAYVGGALGLHWTGGDFPQDDPPPGGAIVFERWTKAGAGDRIVVRFRSQTLDEMRDLKPLGEGALTTLKPVVCGDKPVCDANAFKATLDRLAR